MKLFVLTLLGFLGFVKTQNLLLIGGALEDDNAAIYEKVVDLAVSAVYGEHLCRKKLKVRMPLEARLI